MANEAVYKCSLIMSNGKSGWSDTYWLSKSFSLSQSEAMAKMLALLPKRVRFTDPAVVMEAIRVSDTSNPQAVLIKTVGTALDKSATTVDMINTAVLVTQTSIGGRRKMYLRGVRDAQTNPGSAPQITAQLKSAIDEWGMFLKDNDFCTYQLNQTNNPKRPISNVSLSNQRVLITTTVAHGFSNGQKVYVGKVASSPVVNGYWLVDNATSSSFTLVGSNNTLEEIIWLPGGGYVRGTDKTSNFIGQTDIVRLTTRRAGRPFGLSSGSRRKKAPRLPIRLAIS